MFIPNIRATFSDEQQAIWLPRAEGWEIIGCYVSVLAGNFGEQEAMFDIQNAETKLTVNRECQGSNRAWSWK